MLKGQADGKKRKKYIGRAEGCISGQKTGGFISVLTSIRKSAYRKTI